MHRFPLFVILSRAWGRRRLLPVRFRRTLVDFEILQDPLRVKSDQSSDLDVGNDPHADPILNCPRCDSYKRGHFPRCNEPQLYVFHPF